MFRFAIKNGFRRKGIAFLAIAGSGIGTALMTVLLSLSSGMNTELNNTLNKVAGDVVISAKGSSVIGGFIGGGNPLPVSHLAKIKNLHHIKSLSPQINTAIPKQFLESQSPIGTPLQGLDLGIDKTLDGPSVKIIEGNTITKDDEAIIGKGLLNQNKLTGGQQLTIGQKIIVPRIPPNNLGARSPKNAPDTVTLTIVGIFETGNDINDRNIVTNIATARTIAGLRPDQITSIRVTADSTDNVSVLAKEIEQTLSSTDNPVQSAVSKDLLGDINNTLDIFRNFLLVIAIVAAVAGGVSIMIIMLMSVMERMQEFGIIKAGGWSNRNILYTVFIESITLSLSGALIGFFVGLGIGQIINNYLGSDIAVITPLLTFGVLFFGVAMGVVGGLYPAVRAARVSPVETLKAL
ncbi:ABC transporter permease [Candidatus Saccharibacteria bacterium]|nr:ABC transporter permease [Candidatus Saccharibacteria bacterium]MBI3337682.1 ABC transporter permease [Candidatus Saccharibacteria bacterium]